MTGEAPNTEVASRREVEFSISIRTILLVGVTVAVGWALASVGDVLLLILVSIFGVAVLSPVVNGMERRLPWSRALCSAVLELGIAVLLGAVLVILLQSIVDAGRGFSHGLPGRSRRLGRATSAASSTMAAARSTS
jgi:predicted PurR-regulated permease PerM